MSRSEDRRFLEELKAEKASLKEAARLEEEKKLNERYLNRDKTNALRESKMEKYYQFKNDVPAALIKKALTEICNGSFYNINPTEKAICENLVEQYIGEIGVHDLQRLMKFSENSMLQRLNEKVDSYSKEMTKDANPEDENTLTIDQDNISDFWREIDKEENIEDLTNVIRLRVANAEEEFVNKNAEDKEDIKSILKSTADRIEMAKGTNDNDYTREVEESATLDSKRRIYQIQHGKKHNVFDRIVRNLSEVALSNQDAKKIFTEDNGRLKVSAVVEASRCVYTMLEMVNTLRLEEVNEAYIENMLKSIH